MKRGRTFLRSVVIAGLIASTCLVSTPAANAQMANIFSCKANPQLVWCR